MPTLYAKYFSKRKELEKTIIELTGDSPEIKVDHTISGTDEELSKLQLSAKTKVFGWTCVGAIEKEKPPVSTVNRGEQYKFGINKRPL